MMTQVKKWIFTLNNYTADDEARLVSLGNSNTTDYLVYGREVGDSGTPHLQGFVLFSRSIRFTTAKNKIGLTAHIEAARGTSSQAADYCKKDGDFVEFGTIPNEQGRRTDWERYREWITELNRIPTERELAGNYPALFARYRRACYTIAKAWLPSPSLTTSEPRFGWQTRVAGICNGTPHGRHIHFVVDPVGNSGKSWFCQYAVTKWFDKTQVFRVAKRDDLAFAVDETKSLFLFDVPRCQMMYLQYSVLEMLKDQMIFSPKYESALKILTCVPHVIVFCNEHPDMNVLSADRYNIINV